MQMKKRTSHRAFVVKKPYICSVHPLRRMANGILRCPLLRNPAKIKIEDEATDALSALYLYDDRVRVSVGMAIGVGHCSSLFIYRGDILGGIASGSIPTATFRRERKTGESHVFLSSYPPVSRFV